jgi:hypothetical protein
MNPRASADLLGWQVHENSNTGYPQFVLEFSRSHGIDRIRSGMECAAPTETDAAIFHTRADLSLLPA